MSFLSWKNVSTFQKYYTTDNLNFLSNITKIPLTNYDDDSIRPKEQIINKDIIESTNQDEELIENKPEGTMHHPEPKYWK